MAGKAVRDPVELAAERALAGIGHCPCGGLLAVTGVVTDLGLDCFYRCQVCRRWFERKEVPRAD